VRKATLASILRKSRPGVRLNEHLEHPEGDVVFRHACEMGLEGIVSKRLGSRYRSGRSPDWLEFKNPSAPAVKRDAEEVGSVISTGASGCIAFKASSQSCSGSRTPAFASSMIFRATASRVVDATPSVRWRVTRAISKAKTGRLGVEPMTLQVAPHRHGCHAPPSTQKNNRTFAAIK
jgi:hypothetical protein